MWGWVGGGGGSKGDDSVPASAIKYYPPNEFGSVTKEIKKATTLRGQKCYFECFDD